MLFGFAFDELFITLLERKVRAHDFFGVDGKPRPLRYVASYLAACSRVASPADFLVIQRPWPEQTSPGRRPSRPQGARFDGSSGPYRFTDLVAEVRGESARPYLA